MTSASECDERERPLPYANGASVSTEAFFLIHRDEGAPGAVLGRMCEFRKSPDSDSAKSRTVSGGGLTVGSRLRRLVD